MKLPEELEARVRADSGLWLVTGVAGFIGSNLLEALLRLDQRVRGLDNFATGHRRNLEHVREAVTAEQWARFELAESDIGDPTACQEACRDVRRVLHQAALGSVPRSIEDPFSSHETNVNGTFNMFLAARDQGVLSLVYASSSAVYGDHPELPKVEDRVGRVLSPYAATKVANELDAGIFAQCYEMKICGLRYFNVFGPRQDPEGAYAAVIPKWIAALIKGDPVDVHGDGETSRDFCYIANVVQANLLAALATNPAAFDQVYNIALGARTTLNELFGLLRDRLAADIPGVADREPVYGAFRAGDVRHSHADIGRAQKLLGYAPNYAIGEGLDASLKWYRANVV